MWRSTRVFVCIVVLSLKASSSTIQLPDCPKIITRAEWQARPTRGRSALPGPVQYVFIHHGASGDCFTPDQCAATVRRYQNYHMDSHKWDDIGYSFLVGEDGNAYEGRGWDRVGAHTLGYNTVGLGFCMIGNFMQRLPNKAALNTLKQLIACGVQNGKIQSNYTLRGHRDMGSTSCPGTTFYNLIQTWPHYT
ncbi:hypothetical protein SNE40_007433 [Patella caerulea]